MNFHWTPFRISVELNFLPCSSRIMGTITKIIFFKPRFSRSSFIFKAPYRQVLKRHWRTLRPLLLLLHRPVNWLPPLVQLSASGSNPCSRTLQPGTSFKICAPFCCFFNNCLYFLFDHCDQAAKLHITCPPRSCIDHRRPIQQGKH